MSAAFASPARSQSYTLTPFVSGQYFTTSGTVAACNACLLNAYLSGTSTRRDTYSDTSGTTNANPVVLSSAGRATVYLAVGVSYRLVLTNSTGGTTYWDIDPVTAVPSSAGNLDVTATAGEALTANDVVYLSDGTGSLTAGRWYQADADNTYESSTAGLVGFATAAIASGATGTVRIAGRMTALSSLTTGEFYYASATAGALTATPPTNQRFIGEADSTTTLVIGRGSGSVVLPDSDGTHRLALITTSNLTGDRRITIVTGDANRELTLSADVTLNQSVATTSSPSFSQFRPPQGRCTLTSGTPVTTSDVTAATTIYYALYGGNQITLYDGSTRWVQTSFTELSLTVPSTTATMYDVFVDYTAGTPALEAVAWTNDTTRAALATQNGAYVQTGDTDSLYVCSFRTTAVSGQTENSLANRFLWNYFHRVTLPMAAALETANSWTYTTATIRQANANTANQLNFIIGVSEDSVQAEVVAAANSDAATREIVVGIGMDTTTAFSNRLRGTSVALVANQNLVLSALYEGYPGIGRHYLAWLEFSEAAGTSTWIGDNNGPTRSQSGIQGRLRG